MRFSHAALLALALPLIEIAGFVLVGSRIGVLPTIGLVLAGAISGVMLLRIQGFGLLSRIRTDVAAGRDPGRQLLHGVMIAMAGLLLLIPGFFTDIVGLLLFIPGVRELGWRALKGRLASRPLRTGARRPAGQTGGPVIELDPGDYARRADPGSPWSRREPD